MAIGASLKEYTKDASGTITVKRPDGTISIVSTSDPLYKSTVSSMHADGVKNIGVTQTSSPTTGTSPQLPSTRNVSTVANTNNYDSYIKDLFNSSIAGYRDASSEYSDYLNKAMEQSRDATQSAIDTNVKNIQANADTINQNYGDMAREAFIKSKVGQKNLNEQMALNGINGGASESARLGIETAYENTTANLSRDKQNSLNQLQRDIDAVKANGNMQLASMMSQYYEKLAQSAIEQNNTMYNRLMDSLNVAMNMASLTGELFGQKTLGAQEFEANNIYRDNQIAISNKEFDYNLQMQANEQKQRNYSLAMDEIATFGKILSPSLIQAVGGQAMANQMASAYALEQAKSKKKSSSSSGSSIELTDPTEEKATETKTTTGEYVPKETEYYAMAQGKYPEYIINRYQSGEITYDELKRTLGLAGLTPQQFNIYPKQGEEATTLRPSSTSTARLPSTSTSFFSSSNIYPR